MENAWTGGGKLQKGNPWMTRPVEQVHRRLAGFPSVEGRQDKKRKKGSGNSAARQGDMMQQEQTTLKGPKKPINRGGKENPECRGVLPKPKSFGLKKGSCSVSLATP